jgi:hypothetical protein
VSAAADEDGEVTYSATIPGSQVTAGSMIRWRVEVRTHTTDSSHCCLSSSENASMQQMLACRVSRCAGFDVRTV